MSSSQPTSLAHLPGYDTAPDVYETPESDLTSSSDAENLPASDADTVMHAAGSATSSDSEDQDPADGQEEDEESEDDGIVRRRLHPSRARARFSATAGRVRTSGVDLSERVDGGRKGFRVRSSGRSGAERGQIGGKEGLEQRMARLRVEIEECRLQASREGGGEERGDEEGDVDRLSALLTGLETGRARPRVLRASSGVPGTYPAFEEGGEGGTATTAPVPLGRVADFDARLTTLEQALGLSTLEVESGSVTAAATPPLLPTLTLLDRQMSALMASSSLAGLDRLAGRLRKIRLDAEEFAATTRQSTSENGNEDEQGDDDSDTTAPATTNTNNNTMSQDDLRNLHALYALLPTLQNLAPTVPALLARLRSLRTLHASAATAASELDEVEQRQTRLDRDLQGWRQGLEKVEQAVHEASEANGRNGTVVDGWVKELEGRVKGLSR